MLAGVASHIYTLHGDAEGRRAQLAQNQVTVGNVLIGGESQGSIRSIAAQLWCVEDGEQEEINTAIVRVKHGGNDILIPDTFQTLLYNGGLNI